MSEEIFSMFIEYLKEEYNEKINHICDKNTKIFFNLINLTYIDESVYNETSSIEKSLFVKPFEEILEDFYSLKLNHINPRYTLINPRYDEYNNFVFDGILYKSNGIFNLFNNQSWFRIDYDKTLFQNYLVYISKRVEELVFDDEQLNGLNNEDGTNKYVLEVLNDMIEIINLGDRVVLNQMFKNLMNVCGFDLNNFYFDNEEDNQLLEEIKEIYL